ncbi:MAG TPA: VWA domain-containing protein, partial [Pirellulaceae bacterium]|nr:VWA domain-containing protein [Pirellulaceae bacterium]
MIGEKVREQFVVVAGVADGPDALESIIDLPLTDLTLEMPDAPNLAETLALNPVTMQTLTDDAGGAPGELADVVTGGLDDQITETVARLTGGGGEGDGAGTGQGDGLGGLGLDGDFKKMIENAQQNGLDLVIVFDSTGSMGAEIEGVKRQIFQIGSALLNKVPTTRISLVTYRDKGPGEQFDVQGLELTSSVSKLTQFMTPVQANGGGDHEEGVELGLHWATTYNKFRPKARKVILIFGDAPPHSRDLAACERMAAEFHRYQSGIVTTVTIRGQRPMPEFAAIAKAGGGEAYTNQQPERLMSELLVLTFGAKHRQDVAKFFNLAPAGGRPPTRPTRPASPARGPSR